MMKTITLLGLVAIKALLILPTSAVRAHECTGPDDCSIYKACVKSVPWGTLLAECTELGHYNDWCTDKNWPEQDTNDPFYQGYGPCQPKYTCIRESVPGVMFGRCKRKE